jgi:hypothetical protein
MVTIDLLFIENPGSNESETGCVPLSAIENKDP